MGDDRRCVADEGAAVETKRGKAVAAALDDAVQARPVVVPEDLAADANDDVRGVEGEVDDLHSYRTRTAGLDGDRARHRRSVDAADVVVGRGEGEYRRRQRLADGQRWQLEDRR